ncbi:MAG: tRNA (guanosine(46)-N7)-methyltransferase TrmB [Spirochaetales bacterium]|nr:tRNA (guanosine(46)-N7)-methyltransferase TrmB [Candidatus Physcosoma equi]
MEENQELFDKLHKIEIREGKERTIKSYVLRNNVLEDKEKEIVTRYMEKGGLFFEDKPMDYAKVFGNENPTIIEIGFGNGDTTAKMALINPEYNYIGLEVYLKGFVRLLGQIGENNIDNLKIMRFNAVDVLEHMIPDGSIHGFHIFFPDPWPKKKHHKRRIMNPEFLHLLATKLAPGGYIYMVTDWEEYAEEVLPMVDGEPLLMNPFYGFAPPVTWRPQTKFEQKGMAKDYIINEIWFERKK